MNWHTLPSNKVFETIGSNEKGITPDEAKTRLEKHGPNELTEKKKKPAWVIFLRQFKDFMILILIVAAVISGFLGELPDTIIILVIVVLNAIVGFIQEYRAEKAMEALKKMATPHANVVRDGKVSTISSIEIVPGDVVLLEAGDVVPADLRLTDTHSLRIEESSLTGESVPVDKTSQAMEEEDLLPGDRINMAYKSTLVINGNGSGIAIGTGMDTEIGKIAGMLQEQESMTPLQKRMSAFGKNLSYIILVICVILFGVGWLRGEDPLKMLLVSISLAVAAIPEALPALITIALARGAKRMVKKNVLIRKLHAVETLGSVTFICSDKTGTLTQNKMKVVEVAPGEDVPQIDEKLSFLECSMLLNQNIKKTDGDKLVGDPTEIALVEYVREKFEADHTQKFEERFPRKAELPFDSDRKCMTTIHPHENKFIAISKGASEYIVSKLKNDGNKEKIFGQSDEMASKGIRVLAYAWRGFDNIPDTLTVEDIEKDLEFTGLTGLIDPPREEVKPAIKECTTAGIKAVMITGDHKETAAAIARDIGILQEDQLVMTGHKLAKLNESELDEKVERIGVYARVSPQQKLDIVKSLQRRNHFIAMTGDGVNDAPSLKAANIGIAMGINGTDVSKEAAHMILLDDNFATIVKAVKEGRRIYDNIRKFVKYIMTGNSAEIWTIFLAPLLGLPIPLLPVHILWINLITDSLPGLALSAEKAEKKIMQRPPRKPDESMFAGGIGYHIIWVGLLMTFFALVTQAWAVNADNPRWQTMVFTIISLSQLAHVMAIRTDDLIYKNGLFTNVQLVGAVALTFVLQLGVIYLPFANEMFKTQPLHWKELAICIGIAVLVFHAVEAEKLIRGRIRQKKELVSHRANRSG